MFQDDPIGDRQSQADMRRFTFGGEEGFEDSLVKLGSDARRAVLDVDPDYAAAFGFAGNLSGFVGASRNNLAKICFGPG